MKLIQDQEQWEHFSRKLFWNVAFWVLLPIGIVGIGLLFGIMGVDL